MKEMAKPPRLFKPNNTYYFKAAIPADIKDTFPKSVIKFSLKTKDYQEALKLVRRESARVDEEFEAHRRKLKAANSPALDDADSDLLKTIIDKQRHLQILSDEKIRDKGFYSDGVAFDTYVTASERFNKSDRDNYAQGIIPDVYYERAEELLAEEGVRLKPTSETLRKLAKELMAISIETHKIVDKRNQGEVIRTPEAPEVISKNNNNPKLSETIERYCNQMANNGNAIGTLEDKREAVKVLIEIIGDKPISDYTKDDVRNFKDVFQWFPANKNKRLMYAGMTAREVSEYVRTNNLPPMSNTTRRKYVGNLQTLWNWFANEYDEKITNHFRGANWRKDTSAAKVVVPFTKDELEQMFKAPIYTGCQSERDWKKQGNVILKDSSKYWIPLLALYTGARLEEICQLYVENIRFEHGVNFLDITDEGEDQKLKKGAASRKDVPIHKDLIEIGFLDFVERKRAEGHIRLFPELTINSYGKYGANFSKHAARFFKACGVKHKNNNFHSFRHTFIDACRDADIPADKWHRLTGHKMESIGEKYGRGFMLPKLDIEIQKIDYGLEALKK